MIDTLMAHTRPSPPVGLRTQIPAQQLKRHIVPSMILAPSAHNTQPWRFEVEAGKVHIFVDWQRHLNISDPTQRQLYISTGCALANGIVAGRYWGYETNVRLFPQGIKKDVPVATIIFSPGHITQEQMAPTPLFTAIEQRRTDRTLYTAQPVSDEERKKMISSLHSEVVLVDDKSKIKEIGRLSEEATVATLSRADFKHELSQWVRNNWTSQNDGMPGYAMGVPAPMSLLASVMVKYAPIHKQEGPKIRQQIESAPLVAVVATDHDTPKDWIAAGQIMQNMWLEATVAGLAAAPLASAIEATPEIRRRLQSVLATEKFPQAILRIGHSRSKRLRSTPRRTLEDCVQE